MMNISRRPTPRGATDRHVVTKVRPNAEVSVTTRSHGSVRIQLEDPQVSIAREVRHVQTACELRACAQHPQRAGVPLHQQCRNGHSKDVRACPAQAHEDDCVYQRREQRPAVHQQGSRNAAAGHTEQGSRTRYTRAARGLLRPMSMQANVWLECSGELIRSASIGQRSSRIPEATPGIELIEFVCPRCRTPHASLRFG